MYSLGVRNQQERVKLGEAAAKRRYAGSKSVARKEHALLQIYGKTSDELAEAANQRREATISASVVDPSGSCWALGVPKDPVGTHHLHSFRDRRPESERAHSAMSARRYVPRACYGGGGVLDRARTASLDRSEPVNCLEPRLATASVFVDGRRVRQPAWEPSTYALRDREASKDLGPPLRFAATNEAERVHQHLEANTILNNNSEWTGNKDPRWRSDDPTRWVASRAMRLTLGPAPMETHTIDGRRHEAALRLDDPYSNKPLSSNNRGRSSPSVDRPHRDPWETAFRLVEQHPRPAAARDNSCHASLRGYNYHRLVASHLVASQSANSLFRGSYASSAASTRASTARAGSQRTARFDVDRPR